MNKYVEISPLKILFVILMIVGTVLGITGLFFAIFWW